MPSIEEQADWLTVVGTANSWMCLASQVRRQATRDREIGKIRDEEWFHINREMSRAWDVFSAECDVAFALHAAQRIEVPLETIVADLRRDQQ
jgi:hypothetical protein